MEESAEEIPSNMFQNEHRECGVDLGKEILRETLRRALVTLRVFLGSLSFEERMRSNCSLPQGLCERGKGVGNFDPELLPRLSSFSRTEITDTMALKAHALQISVLK